MIDQLFESFRKASESSMQMQRDLFQQWSQQWLGGPFTTATNSTEWYRTLQRRWFDLTISVMNKNREALDAAYRSGIEALEQLFRLTDARSAEDTRQILEDFWRKLFDNFKVQSEAQFRDFQEWSAKSFEMVNSVQGARTNGKGHQA
jgi:hypothetical protein